MHLVLAGGERYPMLVDSEGMPDFWVTLYVSVVLRADLKQTAIENTIRDILHLKLWEEINGRDLIAEMRQAKFLSDSDITSIRDHCWLNTRHLREWEETKIRKNATKLSVSFPVTVPNIGGVSKGHATNRLAHIASFLDFTARAMLRRRANFVSLTASIDALKINIIKQKPKGQGGKSKANGSKKIAPSLEVFDRLMKVVREDSADNPYKNPAIRTRNALMFDVMYETGMRTGEVLALRIEDLDSQAGTLSVVRRHDDPDDPRKRQPVPKTSERDIPIRLELAKNLRAYVMEVRSKVPRANQGPYLFVTHKSGQYQGQPLSDSTFRNRVLGPAVSTNLELFNEICRHGFRHNFNYQLSKQIDAHNLRAKTDPTIEPINEKKEIQIRMYLNGWISEATAATYNKRHTQEVANKLMLDDMNEQSKHLVRVKK